MQTTRKWLSVILAFALVLSTMSLCLSASAEGDVMAQIIVPETIYLKPGTGQAQYYIAGASSGSAPSPTKYTFGTYSFTASTAVSSITVAVTLRSGGTPVANFSAFHATNSAQLSGEIANLTMPTAKNDLLIWTFDYTIDGVDYSSSAYTYVYAPYLGQTGAQGSFTYKTAIGNEPKLCVYSFLNGIHATDGGPYASAFTGTLSNYFMSPMVEGWSAYSNVPRASERAVLYDAATYFPEDAHGGVTARNEGRDRDGNTDGHNYGSTEGYGILMIDQSRYSGASFGSIPNFTAGFYVFGSESSSVTHCLYSFEASSSASTISFASSVDYANEATGRGYYPFAPLGTIPSASTDYSVTATYKMKRSSSSTVTMTYTFGLHVVSVNKSALRNLVHSMIAANRQARDYEAADFAAYQNALQNAAAILGKPDASANDISLAADLLSHADLAMQDETTHRLTVQLVDATCTTDGYAVYRCGVCGAIYQFATTPALGHDYAVTSQTEPTCTAAGSRTFTCTRCARTYTEAVAATGHTYESWTPVDEQTHTSTCIACGFTTIVSHAFVEDSSQYVAPSETEDIPGERVYVCSKCEFTKREIVPSALHTGHTYTAVVTEPTCTEDGYTTYTCSGCGDTYTGLSVPALGHDFVETVVPPTCTEAGYILYVCTRCEYSYEGDEIAGPHHEFMQTVVPPTCTEGGYTEYNCVFCGYAYQANETQPLGHSWNAGVVTAEPTPSSEGEMTYTCTRCGETYTEAIPPLEGVGEIVVEGCTAYAGMDVLVTVSLRQNPGIVATRLALSYDPNVLTLLEANRGDLPSGGAFTTTNDLNAVPFYIAWEDSLSTVDYTEDGIFAVFKFRVADNAPVGSTAVTVTYDAGSTYNTNLIDRPFTVLNGEVNVIQRISGDANGDFTLDLKDVTVLRRCLAGWEGYSIDEVCADYNGDGVVNLKDVTLIRRFLAGWTRSEDA